MARVVHAAWAFFDEVRMTARNANWDRWTYASIVKHLTTEITSPVVFDFGGKRTSVWENANHRAEVTISGLTTKQKSRKAWRGEVSVFVVVSSNKTSNNYDHVDVVGDVANALDQCILVMDWGATGLEEVARLGQARGDDGEIKPTHIKPKDTDDRLHSTISGTFDGTFRN